jgi:hypothetical protein
MTVEWVIRRRGRRPFGQARLVIFAVVIRRRSAFIQAGNRKLRLWPR